MQRPGYKKNYYIDIVKHMGKYKYFRGYCIFSVLFLCCKHWNTLIWQRCESLKISFEIKYKIMFIHVFTFIILALKYLHTQTVSKNVYLGLSLYSLYFHKFVSDLYYMCYHSTFPSKYWHSLLHSLDHILYSYRAGVDPNWIKNQI